MIEPRQSLKATQAYGKKLERLRVKFGKLNQAIYDLGTEAEQSLPDTKHGGLLYQKIMELDLAMDAASGRIHGIVVHVSDLNIDDCDPTMSDEV